MPKKSDDSDVDETLEKWGESCKGWHTLVFMLKTKLIKAKGKKDGGEGPSDVRSMSPLFKYRLQNFAANLDKIRKVWKEKGKSWSKSCDPSKVDPEILAKAAAAGYKSDHENGTDDDDGEGGLDDLDEGFGGKFLSSSLP